MQTLAFMTTWSIYYLAGHDGNIMVGSVADLGEGPGGVRVVVRLVYVRLLLLLNHVVLLLVRHKGRSMLLLLAVVNVDWLLHGNHLLERRRRHGSSLVLVVPVWLIEKKIRFVLSTTVRIDFYLFGEQRPAGCRGSP